MAKAKTKVKAKSKSPKKGAKSAKKGAGSAKKPPVRAVRALSQEERQRLLKPADGYTELCERFAATWSENKNVKVPGASPAKILSAIARAKKAAAREEGVKRQLEEKLRPLQDARLIAEHDAWKLVLDVYAVAKAQARVAPEIGRAFAFLGETLSKRTRKKPTEPEGEPKETPA